MTHHQNKAHFSNDSRPKLQRLEVVRGASGFLSEFSESTPAGEMGLDMERSSS